MATAYATLNLIKQYGALNQDKTGSIASGRDDAILADAIDAYSREVDAVCGWSFYSETVVGQVFSAGNSGADAVITDNKGFTWLRTDKPNVQSVSALAYKLNWQDAWTPIAAAAIIVNPLRNTDLVPSGDSYRIGIDTTVGLYAYRNQTFWLQASYVGGYATVPTTVARATSEWIWYDYKLSEAIPMGVVNWPAMGMTVRPMKVPDHIMQLLVPWQRPWI